MQAVTPPTYYKHLIKHKVILFLISHISQGKTTACCVVDKDYA